ASTRNTGNGSEVAPCNRVMSHRRDDMPELKSQVTPLLPLTTGVVLPGMVVTIALETDEARNAIAAARAADQTVLLVPRVDGRYARVGTVAQIEDVGRLPSGIEALVVRGLHRARLGTGVPGTGDATWIEVEPIEDPEPTERAIELGR